MDSAANKSAVAQPQAPLPTLVKRRGRGPFSSGLHCDAPPPASSHAQVASKPTVTAVLDAGILRADDDTKMRALPAHLAAFKDAVSRAKESAEGGGVDEEAEADRLVTSSIGDTIREQLFRRERRRRHIVFVGNMYALAGGIPFGQEDTLGVPVIDETTTKMPPAATADEVIPPNDAAAVAAGDESPSPDPVVSDTFMAISKLSDEQREKLLTVAFWGSQQGMPDGYAFGGDGSLVPAPTARLGPTGEEPNGLYFLAKYLAPESVKPEEETTPTPADAVNESVISVGTSAPTSAGYTLAKLRRIEHRIVCRVQALRREREIGCRVRLIKHRGAKPARLASKYIMGVTLSLDAVAAYIGDQEVLNFPATLFSEDRVLRTLLSHLQSMYGRSNLLKAGGGTKPPATPTTPTVAGAGEDTNHEAHSGHMEPAAAVALEGVAVKTPAVPTPPSELVPDLGEEEDEQACDDEEALRGELLACDEHARLVECQRRVVAMQAALLDGVHPLTVAEGDGGGTEAALDTYHASFFDSLDDEHKRAVGNEAIARESTEDAARRRDQQDRIAALAARKLVALTSPVLTSFRFRNLSPYLTSELKRLWNSEDIRKQKVTIKFEFGKAYFSTSSSDPVGQLFGQGAKMLGSRGHRFYNNDGDNDAMPTNNGSNNPHDKPAFPTLVSKLNAETAQLYYINDAPLTVARAMDRVCAYHGRKYQKEVSLPQKDGSAPESTLMGRSNCERIKYSSVRIYFFSKLKQTHVVTRAVWDSPTNAFKLVDIEHVGITFSWLMMHLGSKKSDAARAGDAATQGAEADAFTSTAEIPPQDRLRCLPVELQFRAFHRSKAATSLESRQQMPASSGEDSSTTYHPIESKARSILARLTSIEHDRLKYGNSLGEDVYEEAGVTDEMLDSQRVARDFEETVMADGGNVRHADSEAAYEVTSIVVEHVDTRKIIDLGLNLDNAESLTIELRPPPRVRNNIDRDPSTIPLPTSGLVHTEKPFNIFRTRSCNVHWKMDMERRYQQYLQQHDAIPHESLEAAAEVMLEHHSHVITSLLQPMETAMRVVEEVLAWAEELENDRASLPNSADMKIRKRPMEDFEEVDADGAAPAARLNRPPQSLGDRDDGDDRRGYRGRGHSSDDDDEDPFAWGEDSAAMSRERRGGRGTARGRSGFYGRGNHGNRGGASSGGVTNNRPSHNFPRGGRGMNRGRGGGGDAHSRPVERGTRDGGRGGAGRFTFSTGTFRRNQDAHTEE